MVVDKSTGGRTDFAAIDLNGDYKFQVSGNNPDTVSVTETDNEGKGKQVQATGSEVAIDQGSGFVGGDALVLADQKNQGDNHIVCQSDGTCQTVFLNPGQPTDQRVSWREIRR